MNDIGHLYVLANSAMPGLIKIGKTTRSPTERAYELSSATGLPTPFIVVYEQLFSSCSSAELFVHTYLALRGHRVSDNREFFNAPVNDVIRAIAQAPGAVDSNVMNSNRSDGFTDAESSELGKHAERLESKKLAPWKAIYRDAGFFHLGTGETLQDYKKAIELYFQAAKLGAIPAYSEIGTMHYLGHGVQKDFDKAIAYFTEGTSKGNIHCYWNMGMLFTIDKELRHPTNAEKCFSKFISKFNGEADGIHFTVDHWASIVMDCYRLLIFKILVCENYPDILNVFFREYSDVLVRSYEDMLIMFKGSANEQYRLGITKARDYLNSIATHS